MKNKIVPIETADKPRLTTKTKISPEIRIFSESVLVISAFLVFLALGPLFTPQKTRVPYVPEQTIRVAGIKEGWGGFPSRIEHVLTKIDTLMAEQGEPDLIVLSEFLFIPYSEDTYIMVDCPEGEYCSLSSDVPGGETVIGYINQIRGIASNHHINFSLVVEEKYYPDLELYPDLPEIIYPTSALVINREGEIIGKKWKMGACGMNPNPTPEEVERCELSLTTVKSFDLQSHSGGRFSILPVICGERDNQMMLDAVSDAKVDIIAHSVAEGDGALDGISEYLHTGTLDYGQEFIEIGHLQQPGQYYGTFFEEYIIARDVLKEDGYIVGADDAGGQAGVFSLNRRRLEDLVLTENYVFGVVEKPSDNREGQPFEGLGDKNNLSFLSSIKNSGILYLGTLNYDGLEIFSTSNGENFNQININGFGEKISYAATDMAFFLDKLYVSTRRTLGVPQWGDPFNGGEIWRYDGAVWEPVVEDGFGDADNRLIDNLTVFNNYLYAVGLKQSTGMEIWRTADGQDWQLVTDSPPWDIHNKVISMFEFDGYLYAGTQKTTSYNDLSAAELWRTPDGINWEQVIDPNGFGDDNNVQIFAFEDFNGNLYAATGNYETGAEIWRSADGLEWSQANSDGFGDAANLRTLDMAVFQNQLVAATHNFNGGEIWKSSDGLNWALANTNGFGVQENQIIQLLKVFDGKLYAGTWNPDGAQLWATNNLTEWTIVSSSE